MVCYPYLRLYTGNISQEIYHELKGRLFPLKPKSGLEWATPGLLIYGQSRLRFAFPTSRTKNVRDMGHPLGGGREKTQMLVQLVIDGGGVVLRGGVVFWKLMQGCELSDFDVLLDFVERHSLSRERGHLGR
jgi:hypothetical protein